MSLLSKGYNNQNPKELFYLACKIYAFGNKLEGTNQNVNGIISDPHNDKVLSFLFKMYDIVDYKGNGKWTFNDAKLIE